MAENNDNNNNIAFITDDEDNLCYASNTSRCSHASTSTTLIRVLLMLQRQWRRVHSRNNNDELDSLRFLHNMVVGIQRVLQQRVLFLMEPLMMQCQGNCLYGCQVYEEVSLACVEEARILRNFLTVSVAKAIEDLPFPLDEDITAILDDYLVIVKSSFECFIIALSQIPGHPMEEMFRIFRLAYFDASGNHDLLRVVINQLSYIINTFK
jgi:hypothetical protein